MPFDRNTIDITHADIEHDESNHPSSPISRVVRAANAARRRTFRSADAFTLESIQKRLSRKPDNSQQPQPLDQEQQGQQQQPQQQQQQQQRQRLSIDINKVTISDPATKSIAPLSPRRRKRERAQTIHTSKLLNSLGSHNPPSSPPAVPSNRRSYPDLHTDHSHQDSSGTTISSIRPSLPSHAALPFPSPAPNASNHTNSSNSNNITSRTPNQHPSNFHVNKSKSLHDSSAKLTSKPPFPPSSMHRTELATVDTTTLAAVPVPVPSSTASKHKNSPHLYSPSSNDARTTAAIASTAAALNVKPVTFASIPLPQPLPQSQSHPVPSVNVVKVPSLSPSATMPTLQHSSWAPPAHVLEPRPPHPTMRHDNVPSRADRIQQATKFKIPSQKKHSRLSSKHRVETQEALLLYPEYDTTTVTNLFSRFGGDKNRVLATLKNARRKASQKIDKQMQLYLHKDNENDGGKRANSSNEAVDVKNISNENIASVRPQPNAINHVTNANSKNNASNINKPPSASVKLPIAPLNLEYSNRLDYDANNAPPSFNLASSPPPIVSPMFQNSFLPPPLSPTKFRSTTQKIKRFSAENKNIQSTLFKKQSTPQSNTNESSSAAKEVFTNSTSSLLKKRQRSEKLESSECTQDSANSNSISKNLGTEQTANKIGDNAGVWRAENRYDVHSRSTGGGTYTNSSVVQSNTQHDDHHSRSTSSMSSSLNSKLRKSITFNQPMLPVEPSSYDEMEIDIMKFSHAPPPEGQEYIGSRSSIPANQNHEHGQISTTENSNSNVSNASSATTTTGTLPLSQQLPHQPNNKYGGKGKSREIQLLISRILELEQRLKEHELDTLSSRKYVRERMDSSEGVMAKIDENHKRLASDHDDNLLRVAKTEQYLDAMRRDISQLIVQVKKRWKPIEYIRQAFNNMMYYCLAYLVPVLLFIIRGGRDMFFKVRSKTKIENQKSSASASSSSTSAANTMASKASSSSD